MKNNLLNCLCFFIAFTAMAQTKSLQKSPPLTEASPASVDMSAERLQRIDAMCQEAIEEGQVPGIVALVARKGKIVYHKAFGHANIATDKAMEKDAIFRIASQSKAITSTAVMMLWEEGHFQLDDPVSKYIPEFKNPQLLKNFRYSDTTYTTEPAEREITIRHLLTHTSGLGYGMIDGDERFKMMYQKAGVTDLFTTEDITIEESVKRLAQLPLHHNPGDAYTYSEGLDVLGYFIEVISGMPFDEFLQERLFDLLGMDDTGFYLPDSKADRLVAVQHKVDGAWEPLPVTFYDPEYPIKGAKTFFSGGAGLSSTARDYATFLQMYINGGELNGTRFLSRTTIQSMMANQIGDLWEGTGRHYGLAFGVLNKEGEAMGGRGSSGTFDWGGYFNTQYFADPVEDIIGIIMKQTRGPVDDQTGWKFRLLVGQAVDN
ncbi:CubicO group peptidase (beta-lactamase class C family) [Catalinimonas alkaloidigena]|uniref:serine hydrolase domain-containing protein n=1 Tax=Catalinimonas alkaloidigena TaxID=1075417 RepID=UPI002404C2A6|nr:serine hydrolase domain-containing protein [Catalinimonas alkaloidigena]MDF9799908.1 CubicO group peptidase (beta-lactamase class C family) [Catalinimonas alkaloidigena]